MSKNKSIPPNSTWEPKQSHTNGKRSAKLSEPQMFGSLDNLMPNGADPPVFARRETMYKTTF